MSIFKNKVVVIISQQDWGPVKLSKHHYAIVLANAGAMVYYIPGPDQKKELPRGTISIVNTEFANLFILKHSLYFPYSIKFRSYLLYRFLLKKHIKKILSDIGDVDYVWSFDLSNTLPINLFPSSSFKIFMPVDEPNSKKSIEAATGAKIILSVTREILSHYNELKTPCFFINHGVQNFFINNQLEVSSPNTINIKVILSGNFLRPDIDWETLFEIIDNNRTVSFLFYGPYDMINNNISSVQFDEKYIQCLKSKRNVQLFGIVSQEELAAAYKKADAFLICYNIEKDQSKGTNYHKIMEFLGSGKVVISNNVTTYKNSSDLVVMPEERNNQKLPSLFKHVITNLDKFNTRSLQQKRVVFASSNTYENNLIKIEQLIQENSQ